MTAPGPLARKLAEAERDRYAEALVNLAHPHGYGPLCEPDKYVACAAARLVAERGQG